MTRLIDALRTVPQVDADQWLRLPLWTRWAIAARASVLLMTFASAAVGGLLALHRPGFVPWLWVVTTLGRLLAHATNNLINDYVDSTRGVDRDNYYRARYGTHVLESGMVSRRGMLGFILATALLALAAGAVAVAARGGLTLPLALAGAFFVLFYTWPLKYIGLGEPAVLLVWGPLMSGGAYYVACGEWSWSVAAIGTVYGLGPTAVLFGKHIDKLKADAEKRIHTLPVLLGERRARQWAMALIVLQFLLLGALVLGGLASWWLLLCLLNIPAARRTLRLFTEPRPAECPDGYPAEVWPLWFAHGAFALNRRLVPLLLGSLLLGAIVPI